MSKRATEATKPTEVESPILKIFDTREIWPFWGNSAINPWACTDVLRKFFRLGRAKQIVFVAKTSADTSTYEVEISRGGLWLEQPDEFVLYEGLSNWLRDQIAAGRPHIGVRIVK